MDLALEGARRQCVGVSEDVLPDRTDVVVIGGGHNGLVAATVLAEAGLKVVVTERAATLGGATRTENCFPAVPGLRQSTGAYLLGLMPPEVLALAKGRVRPLRRDPHYVLPTIGGPGAPYLWFGRDRAASRAQLERTFSAADATADDALQQELGQLREDLAPAWLAEPLTVEDTAERYVRPRLRETFVDLVRGTVVDYLARFGFSSELLVTMYVVTDGLSGLTAGRTRAPATISWSTTCAGCPAPTAPGWWPKAEWEPCPVPSPRPPPRPAPGWSPAPRPPRSPFPMVPFRVSSSPTAARSRQRPSWRPAIRGAPRESPVQTRRLSW